MEWGSQEVTNILLALMGGGWSIFGFKLEKRLSRLEWWHEQHHPEEKAQK